MHTYRYSSNYVNCCLISLVFLVSAPSVSLYGSYSQGREALLAQLKGSLKNSQGLQLAVSGDLRNSISSLPFLPLAVGLDGALGRSDSLVEGRG